MNDNFSTTLVKAQQIKDYIKKQWLHINRNR